MSSWLSIDFDWKTFVSLVANSPCQNSTIFSCSGALVVTRRYIHVAPTLSRRRASAWSTW